jgi:hypothetical protein
MEYLADKSKTTKPATLPVPTFGDAQVAFSPAYRVNDASTMLHQGIIFVGTSRASASSLYQSAVYRCEGSVCASTELPGGFANPRLRLSTRFDHDGMMYAFTNRQLFASSDTGKSFQRLKLPTGMNSLTQIALAPDHSELPSRTLFASGWLSTDLAIGGLYRSDDAGQSWTALPINTETFRQGAGEIAVTPTGRLLAAGAQPGIACSDDQGVSWSTRCPPE